VAQNCSPAVGHGEAKGGLAVGLLTFFTAISVKEMRNGTLFTQWIRNRVADFAPVIAIGLGIGAAWYVKPRFFPMFIPTFESPTMREPVFIRAAVFVPG
jgi:hypothetical protein